MRRNAGFDTKGDPQLERMLDAAAKFAASLNYTEPYWLTLSSKSGTGKTHLARAVYRQFMEQNRFELKWDAGRQRTFGNTGAFCNWRRLCSDIRGGAYGLIQDLCDEWFVVLDDIGSERDTTGFIAEAIDRIMNERAGRWTLVTTNLPLREIAEKIDVRVADRMLRRSNVFIEIDAPSHAMRPFQPEI